MELPLLWLSSTDNLIYCAVLMYIAVFKISGCVLAVFFLLCVNFVEFAQKREAAHGYDTVVVFCDVFPKICGDVL